MNDVQWFECYDCDLVGMTGFKKTAHGGSGFADTWVCEDKTACKNRQKKNGQERVKQIIEAADHLQAAMSYCPGCHPPACKRHGVKVIDIPVPVAGTEYFVRVRGRLFPLSETDDE